MVLDPGGGGLSLQALLGRTPMMCTLFSTFNKFQLRCAHRVPIGQRGEREVRMLTVCEVLVREIARAGHGRTAKQSSYLTSDIPAVA